MLVVGDAIEGGGQVGAEALQRQQGHPVAKQEGVPDHHRRVQVQDRCAFARQVASPLSHRLTPHVPQYPLQDLPHHDPLIHLSLIKFHLNLLANSEHILYRIVNHQQHFFFSLPPTCAALLSRTMF